MKLNVFRPIWGLLPETDGPLAGSKFKTLKEVVPVLKKLGYDGIEIWLKQALIMGKDFNALLKDHDMKVIFQIFTDGPLCPGGKGVGGPLKGYTTPSAGGDSVKNILVDKHLQVFKEQVQSAQQFEPVIINSHSLKDYFTVPMAETFFQKALDWEQQNGYKVAHETHRKRFLHSPWVARDFVPKFPTLKLVVDYSHWICMAETNTNDLDFTKVVEDLAPHAHHVHCRVGYDHGPQVSDPRALEWIPYMEGHERWWDAVWKVQAERGDKIVTITPEHGPPNYQQTVPGTKEPLGLIWDINHWVALRRQERFAKLYGKKNTSKLIPSETQGFEPKTKPGKSILEGHTQPIGFKA